MEKTPKMQSKYSRKTNQESKLEHNVKFLNSKITENESPGYLPCTQEGFENIDVVWDWNSPQSKKVPKKSQKRLALSPKTTILKRNLSNNSIQGLEKLQEELRLLKEQIAVPEHEESLILSPIEEADYKNVNESNSIHNIELENFINQADDFFDDSLDEQLIICSTQVESGLNNVGTISAISKINNSHVYNNVEGATVNIKDTSDFLNFNNVARNSELQKLKKLSNTNNNVTIGKVEFYRTQSFEISNLENSICIPLNQKEQIEKKRQEALAKLESKKKPGSFITSPTQCSSVEIEKKRKEALAKREARRQQDTIERKRQEALKRLEMTRKKNAQFVKSSLTSRLN